MHVVSYVDMARKHTQTDVRVCPLSNPGTCQILPNSVFLLLPVPVTVVVIFVVVVVVVVVVVGGRFFHAVRVVRAGGGGSGGGGGCSTSMSSCHCFRPPDQLIWEQMQRSR